jgi:DNA replication protein DnaC
LCGGLGYVREEVPIDHPHFGKLFPCTCKLAEIEQQRLERLRTMSNLHHLAHMTFNNFVPEGIGLPPDKASNLSWAYEMARQYADNPVGWLILFGGFGCGKTHLAAAIANRALQHGRPVLFVVVPDLLDHLRGTFGPNSPVSYDERFEEVRNAPLLILDDLGTQSSTPWAQEKLFQILNHRYNARLATVITSNQGIEEIDLRIQSRMVDPDVAIMVTILAPDFRFSGADQEQSELSSLAQVGYMTFDSFDLRQDKLEDPEERANLQKVYNACREFAEAPSGWLVLTGEFGCGKTHLAAAIANDLVARGKPALFIVVPELLDHLRATFSPTSHVRFDKRFEEVRTAPLLVLDDLGTENASPWAQEKLFQLFNYRYNLRLPTVVTLHTANPHSGALEEVEPRLRTRMLDKKVCRNLAILVPSYLGPVRQRTTHQAKTRRRGRR